MSASFLFRALLIVLALSNVAASVPYTVSVVDPDFARFSRSAASSWETEMGIPASGEPVVAATAAAIGALLNVSFMRPEGVRWYYLYVPQSLMNSAAPVPLTFFFHGFTGAADNALGTLPNMETFGYVLISGQGVPGYPGNPNSLSWNAGTCCNFNGGVLPDDVAWTDTALSTAADVLIRNFSLTLNTSRIFSTGMSNGGMMSERLGCERPDVFSAISSVTGVVAELPGGMDGLAQCTTLYNARQAMQTRSFSVLHIHGTADNAVPYFNTTGSPTYFPNVASNIAGWAQRMNCTGDAQQTLNVGPYSNSVWSCAKSSQLQLVTVQDGGHSWFMDSTFNTTVYTLQFFNQISFPPSPADPSSSSSGNGGVVAAVIIVLLVVAAAVAAGVYYYRKRQSSQSLDGGSASSGWGGSLLGKGTEQPNTTPGGDFVKLRD